MRWVREEREEATTTISSYGATPESTKLLQVEGKRCASALVRDSLDFISGNVSLAM